MSKILFISPDAYIELDAMGVRRWREMIAREFPLLPFLEYMGVTVPSDEMREYVRQHTYALNACDLGVTVDLYHMIDLIDMIPVERIRELRDTKMCDIIGQSHDPRGRVISPMVRKALIFSVPNVVCACGSMDPAYLYWAPHQRFMKEDILSFLATPLKMSSQLDITTQTCAACRPRNYPAVFGSPAWNLYSNSDPRRCRCAACG